MGDAANLQYGDGDGDDGHAMELAYFRNAVETMGVSTKGVDDSACMRFLRARNMHVDKAAKMFVQYHTWRASFVPLGCILVDQVVSELNTGKIALQGHSKKGHPLMIALACKHYPNKHDICTFKRFVVHILDKTIASAPPGVETAIVIVDLNHLGYKNVDIKGFVAGFQLLQNYYPERLGALYMVNVPKFFLSMWKMMARFLDKATTEKIVFLEDHNMTEVLLSEVDAATLPSMFGGKAELVLLQDAHVPHWPPGPVVAHKLDHLNMR
eukprot:c21028_g2_i1 orf=125-928(+)